MYDIIKNYKDVTCTEVAIDIIIEKGEGAWLIDKMGKRYLDFSSGFGVVNIGYNNQEMIDVIASQSKINSFLPPWIPTEESTALANLLINITGLDGYKCIRATGGGDANEIAYRISFANKPGKILSFLYSYHGGSRMNFLIGDYNQYSNTIEHRSVGDKVNPVYPLRHKDSKIDAEGYTLQEIESRFKKEEYSCLIMEPIIGSGGIIPFPISAIIKIQELCKKYNVIFILDEVITGFGRTGDSGKNNPKQNLFYFQECGIKPDILTLAKGMSSGYAPIGVCIANPDLLNKYIKTYHDITSTFAWMPLAAKVSEKNIEIILKNNYAKNVSENAEYLKSGINNLFQKYLPNQTGEVRGIGYMIGVELINDQITKTPNNMLGHKIRISAKNEGLLLCPSWKANQLIFLPPLISGKEEIDFCFESLEKSLRRYAK